MWHALAAKADLQGIPIVDLYYESIINYSDSSKTLKVISDRQRFLRTRTCLLHHHSEVKIQNYFDTPPVYATIVRDPFDRFLSHITYLSTLLRSGQIRKEEMLGLGDPVEIQRILADPSIATHSLIDICSRSDYYQNYFRNWFGKLLLGRNGFGGDEDIKDVYDQRFPEYVRSVFKNISCFTDLNKSFDEIAKAFELTYGHVTLGHLLKISKEPISESVRSKTISYFEKDYIFLQELGFRYKI